MKILTLDEIVKAVEGKLISRGIKDEFNNVKIDSRKIENGDIFIAIKGEIYNANDFAKVACEKHAGVCIVDEIKFNVHEFENCAVIKVGDTNKALLDLAKYYRSTLNIKVIGITGSTGKTSTKDLIAAVLSTKYKVFKTSGNFNNEVGLPLMISSLDETYDIAVLEMGMNHFGEIHKMAEAARPDIAVMTNIGISHMENLGSRENILKAKLEITDFFEDSSILIVNGDNDLLGKIHTSKFKLLKVGINDKFDIFASNIICGEDNVIFDLNKKNREKYDSVTLKLPGIHNVSNFLLALQCGFVYGMCFEDMVKGLDALETTSMRLEITKASEITIINDSYNASPDSMKAAIDVLKNIKCSRRIAVFGSMLELGENSFEEHKSIANYARINCVDILIAIGEFSKAYEEGFIKENNMDNVQNCPHIYCNFENTEKAAEYLAEILKRGDAVLVKASRGKHFETIVTLLKNRYLPEEAKPFI